MPRGPGLDAPNVLLHVMVRGIERRAIFRDDQDRTPFVTRVAAQAVEARVEEVDVIGNVPHYTEFREYDTAGNLQKCFLENEYCRKMLGWCTFSGGMGDWGPLAPRPQ